MLRQGLFPLDAKYEHEDYFRRRTIFANAGSRGPNPVHDNKESLQARAKKLEEQSIAELYEKML